MSMFGSTKVIRLEGGEIWRKKLENERKAQQHGLRVYAVKAGLKPVV